MGEDKLYLADFASACKDIKNGSFAMVNDLRQHMEKTTTNQEIFYWICRHLGLPQRESLGECISCESYRAETKSDLFYEGQTLFYLECAENHTEYRMMRKECGDKQWKEMKPLWADVDKLK